MATVSLFYCVVVVVVVCCLLVQLLLMLLVYFVYYGVSSSAPSLEVTRSGSTSPFWVAFLQQSSSHHSLGESQKQGGKGVMRAPCKRETEANCRGETGALCTLHTLTKAAPIPCTRGSQAWVWLLISVGSLWEVRRSARIKQEAKWHSSQKTSVEMSKCPSQIKKLPALSFGIIKNQNHNQTPHHTAQPS